jgi:hypothetical protein
MDAGFASIAFQTIEVAHDFFANRRRFGGSWAEASASEQR